MLRNIRMVIAYDGTDFHGWQKQPGVRTVQGEIDSVLMRVIRHPIQTNGAGRTDAGVHAAGQVVNFETTCTIPTDKLIRAVGSRLPEDITIRHVCEALPGFRSSYDAITKLYRYRIYNQRNRPTEPHLQRQAWHYWRRLDLDSMRDAASRLVGEHDFAGMASQGAPRLTTVRTICRFDVYRLGFEVRFDVEGTGFLYNQVRNMVGTLLEIGRGHWGPDRINLILESRDRSNAAQTALAKGLCLQWVRYDMTRPAESYENRPPSQFPKQETSDSPDEKA